METKWKCNGNKMEMKWLVKWHACNAAVED